jgi:hypothetical protein
MKKYIFSISMVFSLCFIFSTTLISQGTDEKKVEEKKSTSTEAIPEGYGKLKWGISLKEAKANIFGKIIFTDEKKILISQDNELKYYYGFFYNEEKSKEELFYVSLKFPYLSLEEIKKKVTDKYGEPKTENLTENQGLITWYSDTTIIILIIDNYENKPFCRKIVYLNKEISKKLDEEEKKFFFKKDKANLDKLP